MQVILVKQIRRLGLIGDRINVKDGYGRNYLIPNGFAIRATKDNILLFSNIKQELENNNIKNKKESEQALLEIKGKDIIFIEQSTIDGKLFGSVTARLIAQRLNKLTSYSVTYLNILLDTPIKFNGVYNIKVVLHPDVITELLVVVAKSESDANNKLIKYKEDINSNKLKKRQNKVTDTITSSSNLVENQN